MKTEDKNSSFYALIQLSGHCPETVSLLWFQMLNHLNNPSPGPNPNSNLSPNNNPNTN